MERFAAAERNAFLQISDEALSLQCTLNFHKSTGNGGQKKNKTSSAVRLIHRPTGLAVCDCSQRSQHRNRAVALEKLRRLIARECRSCDGVMLPQWPPVGLHHKQYALWCAEVLDLLAEMQWDLDAAAEKLNCSGSQLLKAIGRDGECMQLLNRERLAIGKSFLHC